MRVLVLSGTLKPSGTASNTEALVEKLLGAMRDLSPIDAEVVRLSTKNIPPGTVEDTGAEDDDWPAIAQKIRRADIIIFATPIWWDGVSSTMQRAIERMDYFDSRANDTGVNEIFGKVGGIVITGSEDGAQAVQARLMEFGNWLGLTFPPQCVYYELNEREPGRNENRNIPMLARNLLGMAALLKNNPDVFGGQQESVVRTLCQRHRLVEIELDL